MMILSTIFFIRVEQRSQNYAFKILSIHLKHVTGCPFFPELQVSSLSFISTVLTASLPGIQRLGASWLFTHQYNYSGSHQLSIQAVPSSRIATGKTFNLFTLDIFTLVVFIFVLFLSFLLSSPFSIMFW